MKQIIVLIFCFLLNDLQAQKKGGYYGKPVHIGIKGGANLIKLDGKGWDAGMKYGFHAGGLVQLKLIGRFSLQTEVLFSQLRADTARDLSEVVDFIRFSESRAEIKLNYLDIPIMLNIAIDELKAIKLQMGFQYGILLNSSQTLLENGKNAFKSGAFSVLGGFMWQLPGVHFGGRYLIGLDNLNNATNNARWKSQTGQIFIGLTI
jgi:hypothetical protein